MSNKIKITEQDKATFLKYVNLEAKDNSRRYLCFGLEDREDIMTAYQKRVREMQIWLQLPFWQQDSQEMHKCFNHLSELIDYMQNHFDK